MSKESQAKRAKILDVLEGYSSLMGRDLTGLTNSLARAAEPYPLDVVIDACRRLAQVCHYPPTPADMTEQCEHFNAAMHPVVVPLYTGIINMDFGHGSIDMRGLTRQEQDKVIDAGGIIDGVNLARLPLEQKRTLIRTGQLAGGVKIKIPRLQKMTDKPAQRGS